MNKIKIKLRSFKRSKRINKKGAGHTIHKIYILAHKLDKKGWYMNKLKLQETITYWRNH